MCDRDVEHVAGRSRTATKHEKSSLDCNGASFCLHTLNLVLSSIAGNLSFIILVRVFVLCSRHDSFPTYSDLGTGASATKQRQTGWGGSGGCFRFSKFLRILAPTISNPRCIMHVCELSEQASFTEASELTTGAAATKQRQTWVGGSVGCFCFSEFLRIPPPFISNPCCIMRNRDIESESIPGSLTARRGPGTNLAATKQG